MNVHQSNMLCRVATAVRALSCVVLALINAPGRASDAQIVILEQTARSAESSAEEVTNAIQFLVAQPELGKHYAMRMRELVDRDSVESDDELRGLFEFLAKLQNDGVVMAVAEFLNEDVKRPRFEGDTQYVAPEKEAAKTLGKMQLPDAPVQKDPETYTEDDIAAWRQWLEQF